MAFAQSLDLKESPTGMRNILQIGLCALAIGACMAARAETLSITGISTPGGNAQLLIQSDIGVTNQIQFTIGLTYAN
jgi:hypothetical protein